MAKVSRIYMDQSVHDAAIERIRFIFDEFDKVVVAFSGGKDSTATLELAIQVAREKGKLPIDVMFIDQEGEWQTVIDYIRDVGERPECKLAWFQVPIKINSSASTQVSDLMCWDEKDEAKWIRPKEPNSIHENTFCDINVYFNDLFGHFIKGVYSKNDESVATLSGVRAEEAPKRLLGLTSHDIYKGVTWGSRGKKKGFKHLYSFYPLYDWSYTDIWHYIETNKFEYCDIYDKMYQIGIPTRKMRVSCLYHENSIDSLNYLAEVEPETWNKFVDRIYGANSFKQLTSGYTSKAVPYMFKDEVDYYMYLLDNLYQPEQKKHFLKKFQQAERGLLKKINKTILIEKWDISEKDRMDTIKYYMNYLDRIFVDTVLHNDYVFTFIKNYIIGTRIQSQAWRKQ